MLDPPAGLARHSFDLRAWLLGQFRVEINGVSLAELRPRCQSLLAFLLLHHRAPEARDHLAFVLWPDSTEAQALTNLRHVLHDLQTALPTCDLIAATHNTIALSCRSFYLDVAEFEANIGADASPAELARGVALYEGDLLPGSYDGWIDGERVRLRARYFSAIERLAFAREREGDLPAALDLAQRLLSHDPLREATYRLIMRLHASNSDRAAALETYQMCSSMLHRELGVAPCPATLALYHKMRA